MFGAHVILVDIGTDWPDVFGPYTNLGDAEREAAKLEADHRVFHVEIQSILLGDAVDQYLNELDEILS